MAGVVVGVAALGAAFAFFRPKPGADADDGDGYEEALLSGGKGNIDEGATASRADNDGGGKVQRTKPSMQPTLSTSMSSPSEPALTEYESLEGDTLQTCAAKLGLSVSEFLDKCDPRYRKSDGAVYAGQQFNVDGSAMPVTSESRPPATSEIPMTSEIPATSVSSPTNPEHYRRASRLDVLIREADKRDSPGSTDDE